MTSMAEKLIERFSRIQVAVHFTGALSILILYITGFPMTFPEQLGWIPNILMGYSVTMFIHRVAGIVLLLVALIVIIYYILNTVFIHESFFKNILPTRKDFSDILLDVKYAFGVGDLKPQYGKYDWVEKLDVFSVIIIDVVVLGISGLIMMMPYLFVKMIPVQMMLSIGSIHAGFAVISVVGILFHIYIAHISPEHFPMNRAIFSGEVSLKEAKENHPEWINETREEGVSV